jgi:hypothetical protein
MRIERLRDMPACRKLALLAEMNRSVSAMALAGLRQRHPNETPGERRRLAALILGEEPAARASGPGPEDT